LLDAPLLYVALFIFLISCFQDVCANTANDAPPGPIHCRHAAFAACQAAVDIDYHVLFTVISVCLIIAAFSVTTRQSYAAAFFRFLISVSLMLQQAMPNINIFFAFIITSLFCSRLTNARL